MDDLAWWQTGVVYQIYPRSFQDSDGDGVGDLPGIRERLPHVADLGVDAVWLSPVFRSPMADFGYDISDYRDVDPLFGTLGDLDAVIERAHGLGLKLILDFVPSHSSEEHPWFVEARASRDGPRRDWYIWRDPAPDGGPPTNWISEFGGSAWTWDEATGQYYLSLYTAEQPALNWRNPAVRAEMLDVLRFWLDRGVDGFRVDAVDHLAPDPDLGDHPENPDWHPAMPPNERHLRLHSANRPEVFEYVREMRRVADGYGDRVLIGEAYAQGPQLMAYYGDALDAFQLPFNFGFLYARWDAAEIAAMIRAYEAGLPRGAWPNWVLGNHDRTRIATRVGARQARAATMLLLTLRGTPTMYQGEELGQEDIAVPPELVRDPWALRNPGTGLGRDPVRAPMRWEAGPGGGFTEAEPWLPLWDGPSAAAQADDAASMLAFTRRLLRLRRAEPALTRGAISGVEARGDVLFYEREAAGRTLAVALNLGERAVGLDDPGTPIIRAAAGVWSGTLAPGDGVILARG